MFSRKVKAFLLVSLFSVFASLSVIAQVLPSKPAAQQLPEQLGAFRVTGPLETIDLVKVEDEVGRGLVTSWAGRAYIANNGRRMSVSAMTSSSDASAYAFYSESRRGAETSGNEGGTTTGSIGTASYYFWDGGSNSLHFYKGKVNIAIRDDGESRNSQPLLDFGAALAETLDKGDGDIPVLIKHLPDWQKASRVALFITSEKTLKSYFGGGVFSGVSFDGGAQAVIASYDKQELVIVEFNTPQLATDNNGRILTRIQELRSQGQPAPAYRRVGNYAVFVFNAQNETAANQLIDQVKYQQVVQWLGENPFAYEQATREFTETTLGVFVSVVKASGLALVTCVTVGGLFGALLFRVRRSQQRAREAYADSDAMLRLNLDELTPESDPSRLLGRGNQ